MRRFAGGEEIILQVSQQKERGRTVAKIDIQFVGGYVQVAADRCLQALRRDRVLFALPFLRAATMPTIHQLPTSIADLGTPGWHPGMGAPASELYRALLDRSEVIAAHMDLKTLLSSLVGSLSRVVVFVFWHLQPGCHSC